MSVWVTRAYADNQNPSHPEQDVKRLNEEKTMTVYFKITSAPAPQSSIRRQTRWGDMFASMKSGDWFYVPKEDAARVRQAATTRVKGKYTMYRVPQGFCFKMVEEV